MNIEQNHYFSIANDLEVSFMKFWSLYKYLLLNVDGFAHNDNLNIIQLYYIYFHYNKENTK